MTELDRYFTYKTQKGLAERGLADKPEYQERLKFELETIIKMGFPGYFLIVQDVINWAKANGIYVGPGRGSAAGSLVSFCLKITDLDPIRWNLLFERFLNPGRVSMPDIDIDFEKRYRDRVIEYVIKKYGQDKVAHIGTFNMQRAKAAVRSVTKTLGHPYAMGDELAKMLLAPVGGKPQPLKLSIERVAKLHGYRNSNSTEGEILRWAERIEDHINSLGVHASGIVISNNSLLSSVPLFLGRSDEVTTQWEMGNIEEAGLIKFDFLGLDALTKIHNCIDIIKARTGKSIDISQIDLEDPDTFAALRSGDNTGIFQLEASSGMRDLLVQIRPTGVEDLNALVAIYRPGPLAAKYKEIYLGVRAGQRKPEYLVPELEPILKTTDGWLIYQEQCMEIAKRLCGYTPSESDDLRKAIGKKKADLMAKHEVKFKEGWVKHGLSEATGNTLWNDIVTFAEYGFNRSHAAAYAYITYQTAYLKTHYPIEFMCAVMISEADNEDQMIKFLAECRRLGIKVLPPDVNKSGDSFQIDSDGEILFGLSPIKNLGESAKKILEERNANGRFTSLRNFCERVDLGVVNRKKLESLIQAGAFDEFGPNRQSMLHAVEAIWNYRDEVKKYASKKATFDKKTLACEARDILIKAGAKLKPLSKPEEPVVPVWPEPVEVDEMSKALLQAAEHELLGFYVSSHPLDWTATRQFGQNFNTIEDIKELDNGMQVSVAVVISGKKEITTRSKKEKMAFLNLEDLTGSMEATIFPSTYKKFSHLLDEVRPLRVTGTVDVTEADDGKVVKMMVWTIDPLLIQASDRPERIEAVIPATRADEFLKILERFKGDVHEVQITLQTNDGTKFRYPTSCRINNQKGAFMRELVRLKDGQEEIGE
jgi:DNA polymerase III subunit alpha